MPLGSAVMSDHCSRTNAERLARPVPRGHAASPRSTAVACPPVQTPGERGRGQGSKAPEPWHFCAAGSGALALLWSLLRSRRQKSRFRSRRQKGLLPPAPAEPGAVSPEYVDYYYLTWFNTPYNCRWHVFAMQTRESESRSVPCSTWTKRAERSARPSIGTGRRGRTGRPSMRARNGTEVRTCRVMPRHSVVERSRIAFSMRTFLETAPLEAASSVGSWRSANTGGLPSLCYTEKATPARHRPERQHNAHANRRKQGSPNETKPYSNPTPPRKRQNTPTNGHTPRRMKPTSITVYTVYPHEFDNGHDVGSVCTCNRMYIE